jgi:hypothetical protein
VREIYVCPFLRQIPPSVKVSSTLTGSKCLFKSLISQSEGINVAVSIEDNLAIRDLYARAIHLFDAGDLKWLDCWAEAPVFEVMPDLETQFPGFKLANREQLSGMIAQAAQMMGGRGLHHFTNFAFDYEGEGVRVKAYLLLVESGKAMTDPGVIRQNMRVNDLVVKADGSWRFKHRTVGNSWS